MAKWRGPHGGNQWIIASVLRSKRADAERLEAEIEEDNEAYLTAVLSILELAGGASCRDAWLARVSEGEDWFEAMRAVLDGRDCVPETAPGNILYFPELRAEKGGTL